MDHSHLRLFDPQGTENNESRTPHTPTNPFAATGRTNVTRATAGCAQGDDNALGHKPTVAYTRVVGEARVAVSVGDLLPLLADAWQSKRAWLGDFASDRVIVSQDLYEVLLAYKRLNKVG